ncbi:MAG TPA: Gfo/Idh/MocA family oxidoreductase [Acetobacteraceae bacterium]
MFRLGLVGAGRMGLTHLRALAGNERVRVVAVAEPSERARQTLDGPGLATYPAVDSMLRSGGLDGVLIAAPSTLHVRIVTELTAARLPVLCEKPCGLTAREAQQAMQIASAANIPLQIAYWRRFVPALRDLRRRIVRGELGELYFLACSQWDGAPPAAAFRSASGGIFVDMGVHEFDQIRWLSGQEFERIMPVTSAIAADPPVTGDAESAQVLCRLSGGSNALVSLGRRFPAGDVCRVEVFGTKDAADSRFLWPPDGEAMFMQALRAQAEGFANWVGGAPATGADATDAVAALGAAEQCSVAYAR